MDRVLITLLQIWGVNMAGNCICDDDACKDASCQEIIRRYYDARRRALAGKCSEEEVYKIEMLMNQAGITVHDRPVVDAALSRAKETEAPAAALELADGRMIAGKTTDLLGPCAALLLNALKELAGIPHSQPVISPAAIEPIQTLKTHYLGSKNPRLHMDEVLIALSVSAASDPNAQKALEQLPNLKGCRGSYIGYGQRCRQKTIYEAFYPGNFEAKYENNSVIFPKKVYSSK